MRMMKTIENTSTKIMKSNKIQQKQQQNKRMNERIKKSKPQTPPTVPPMMALMLEEAEEEGEHEVPSFETIPSHDTQETLLGLKYWEEEQSLQPRLSTFTPLHRIQVLLED